MNKNDIKYDETNVWHIIFFPINALYLEFINHVINHGKQINIENNLIDKQLIDSFKSRDLFYHIKNFCVIVHPRMCNYVFIKPITEDISIQNFISFKGGYYIQDPMVNNIISIPDIIKYLNNIFNTIISEKEERLKKVNVGSTVIITNKNLFDYRAIVIYKAGNYCNICVLTGNYGNKLLNVLKIHKKYLKVESTLYADILHTKIPRQSSDNITKRIENKFSQENYLE